MPIKQVHALYSGSVQGVGFRYRTRSIATGYGLSGWVKNLPDGRVELVAQGSEKILEEFLDRLEKSFEGYISAKQISPRKPEDSLDGFSIVF